MRMAPTANVVAMLEPETAAKIRQVSTHVHASPPCMPPTIDLAKATRSCDMPPISIKFPASMKNGIAASVYLSIDVNKCWPKTSIETLSLSPTPQKMAQHTTV